MGMKIIALRSIVNNREKGCDLIISLVVPAMLQRERAPARCQVFHTVQTRTEGLLGCPKPDAAGQGLSLDAAQVSVPTCEPQRAGSSVSSGAGPSGPGTAGTKAVCGSLTRTGV